MADRHESPDGTVCADPTDPPFVDALGHSYGLSADGHIMLDGRLEGGQACSRICYSGRRAWCQDREGNWRSRGRHDHPWGPPGHRSPLSWDRFAILEEAIVDLGTQLAKVIDSQVAISATENAILQKLQNGGDNADVLDAIADMQSALQSIIQARLDAVQVVLATNQQALLTAIANQSDELSPVLNAIQSLQDELAEDYAAIVALLKEILALLNQNQPTKLALDFPGESVATQSRPDKPGP